MSVRIKTASSLNIVHSPRSSLGAHQIQRVINRQISALWYRFLFLLLLFTPVLPPSFEPILEEVDEPLWGIENGEDVNGSQDEQPALGIGADEILEKYDDPGPQRGTDQGPWPTQDTIRTISIDAFRSMSKGLMNPLK